ncbi:MAG: hypothetical protein EXR95_11295 [Gemmatimonadetes bacterium]|nr:hypothetical protein [Gemmatimonadota bacterium]
MFHIAPPLPNGCPPQFRSTVHGTVFAGRDRHLDGMHPGDRLVLVPDPPGQTDPEVWVHLGSGDPIGHLPREISSWLWAWLREGGAASAVAVAVHGADTPSWRRLLVEVQCDQDGAGRGASLQAGGAA